MLLRRQLLGFWACARNRTDVFHYGTVFLKYLYVTGNISAAFFWSRGECILATLLDGFDHKVLCLIRSLQLQPMLDHLDCPKWSAYSSHIDLTL